MPTLHFHDDESKSTILSMHRAKSMASSSSPSLKDSGSDTRPSTSGSSANVPRSPSPSPTWGGDELLHQMRKYVHVHRSVLDHALFLVNPSRSDLETHSTPLFEDDAIDPPNKHASSSSFGTSQGSSSAWPEHFPDDPFNPTHPMSSRSNRNSALHQSLPGAGPSSRRPDASMDPLTTWAKNARLSVLSSFANLTQQARHASHAVLSHPLAKPVIPRLPQPVQSFAHAGPFPLGPNDGEWEWRKSTIANASGTGEYYDSARVYLAKWARLVAEEGERNRLREERLGIAGKDDFHPGRLDEQVERTELGAFEVLEKLYDYPRPSSERHARQIELHIGSKGADPESFALDLNEWNSLFDARTGLPLLPEHEIRHRVFVNGLDDEARKEAWPFLLNAIPFQSTAQERQAVWRAREEEYRLFKARWQADDEFFNSETGKEQRHRITVDCLRTDRGQPMFASETALRKQRGTPDQAQNGADGDDGQVDNPHVLKLGEILLTYGIWEAEKSRIAAETRRASALPAENQEASAVSDGDEGGLAGYVQGMSDLCSPLYVICEGDEVRTFWCFVGFMDRVVSLTSFPFPSVRTSRPTHHSDVGQQKSNFYRDQSGMKAQLLLLQKLISIMDPSLYAHLERTDSLNLFFCFRWLLVSFKREFPFADTLKLWEFCWASEVAGMPLFVALAILEIHRDVLLRYLENFDEILQYINGLSQGGLDVEQVLAKAEILAKAFAQLAQRAKECAPAPADPPMLNVVRQLDHHDIGCLVGGTAL